MVRHYWNEIDPVKAETIRELQRMGMLPEGDVDERDIRDVDPADIQGYTQCHFFAGIGTWSIALHEAGWPDDRPVWTGSCPCQPFSKAGKRQAMQDDRHLWPEWFRLIAHCRPTTVFGEQVSAEESIGSIQRTPPTRVAHTSEWAWIDHVQFDLEAASYAVGHRSFTAACVGAPQSRGRLYFVANTSQARLEGQQFEGYDGDQWATRAGRLATPTKGSGEVNGWWSGWLSDRGEDTYIRFVESGTQPSIDGSARADVRSHGACAPAGVETQEARVERIEAYGDAIVLPQAQLFIQAAMEVIE